MGQVITAGLVLENRGGGNSTGARFSTEIGLKGAIPVSLRAGFRSSI